MGRVAEVKHGGHKCVLFRLDLALNRVVTVPTIRFENEGRQVSCIKGASLRRAALDDGISIYKGLNNVSNCGGLGQCGTCVMRVLEGAQESQPAHGGGGGVSRRFSRGVPAQLPHLRERQRHGGGASGTKRCR